jgi:hypothetical protein
MTVTVWPARENLQSFSTLWRFEQGQAAAKDRSATGTEGLEISLHAGFDCILVRNVIAA